MSQDLPVIPSELPNGFCPASYQDLLNGFSSHQHVTLPDFAGVIASATPPTDQTATWFQLDGFGRPIRIYRFAQGAWLSLHTLTPGLTQWWFDVLPNFTTFDGGDAAAPSVLSGPMWQQAKNSDGILIEARFPVTAGTLPSTLVLAQGDTGGEEKHALISSEEAPHYHGFGDGDTSGIDGRFIVRPWSTPAAVGSGMQNLDTTNPAIITPAQNSGALGTSDPVPSAGAGDPHQNMPPYVVGYLLQRTGRLYYAVP